MPCSSPHRQGRFFFTHTKVAEIKEKTNKHKYKDNITV